MCLNAESQCKQVIMSFKSALLLLALFGPLCSSESAVLFTFDKWKVTVYTSNEEHAGTNADVVMTIFGKTAEGDSVQSNEINLNNDRNNFERGRVDEFRIETVHIGQPYQIVVKHNNRGRNPAWKLNRIELFNFASEEKYRFKCDCWLSEDAGLEKRILAEGFEVDNWLVSVYTAIALNAGTNANVFLTIFGNLPDGDSVKSVQSEKTRLANERNNFERGELDVFRIETIKLGKPYQITLSHDNTGFNPSWKLDRVELKNLATEEVYTFRCNCWLDTDAGLERTIPVKK